MKHTEKSNAQDSNDATIGRGSAVVEQAHASGKYIVECLAPSDEDRARYIALRDKIATIESENFVRRLLARPLLNELRAEMAAIPLHKKWEDVICNLVTTVGGNDALDKYLAGSAYTAAWYIGLIGTTSYTTGPALGDTSASHGGWAEDQNYSQAARPTAAFSAASGKSKALSSALTFSINATTTIKGCFLISNSTKGGSTGTLYSAGLFTGGDKGPLANGDTLNVSYTATI
jgi:hypothetical protein